MHNDYKFLNYDGFQRIFYRKDISDDFGVHKQLNYFIH
jgi:hypothetical protein